GNRLGFAEARNGNREPRPPIALSRPAGECIAGRKPSFPASGKQAQQNANGKISQPAKSDAGGASSWKEWFAMLEKILFIIAAIATIASFLLDAWRTWRERRTRADDGGERKKEGR